MNGLWITAPTTSSNEVHFVNDDVQGMN